MATKRRQPFCPASNTRRHHHAPEGVYAEQISCNRGHVRERVAAPMVLLPALMAEQIQELHAARTGQRPDDPPLRKTRLDRALDHDGTQSLRWALSRYVCDVLEAQRSPEKAEGAPRRYGAVLPFSAAQQAALARLAHVHARLSPGDRKGLDQFAVMMGARHPTIEPISMAQLGRSRTGLSDDRVQEGAAVERILGLAERLNDLYRLLQA